MQIHATARLGGGSNATELDYVDRETTPEFAMGLGIRAHLAGSTCSITARLLAFLDVERVRTTVHNG
jgi:hypothetical protein